MRRRQIMRSRSEVALPSLCVDIAKNLPREITCEMRGDRDRVGVVATRRAASLTWLQLHSPESLVSEPASL